MKRILMAAFLGVFFCFSCKTANQSVHVQQTTNQQDSYKVEFGESGGFTGSYIKYTLSDSGKLSKEEPGADNNFNNKSVSPSSLQKLRTLIAKQLNESPVNKPGNMNCFIVIFKNGVHIQSNQWPIGENHLPQTLKDLFSELNSIKK